MIILTYVGKPTNTKGIFHGKGNAVVIAEGSELAIYTGEGIGRHDSSGKMNWRGVVLISLVHHQQVN